MKVYVMFNEWVNEGSYEDEDHGFEFYGICDTLDKAIQEIKKHIPEKDQDEEIYELEWESNKYEQYTSVSNDDCTHYVAELRHGDGYGYGTLNETFYIMEEEVK